MLPFGGIYRTGRGPEWMLRCQELLRNHCLPRNLLLTKGNLADILKSQCPNILPFERQYRIARSWVILKSQCPNVLPIQRKVTALIYFLYKVQR